LIERLPQTDALVAMIPDALKPAGQKPIVDCRAHVRDGVVEQIDLFLPEVADDASGDAVLAILGHDLAKDVRRIGLSRSVESWPRAPDVDFGWTLDAIAGGLQTRALEWLFVSAPIRTSFDHVARFATRPKTLVTWTGLARFDGVSFAGIERLDLRDTDVDWTPLSGAFPELATLIVRPRGPASKGAPWVDAIFARPDAVPALRELRAPEHHADEVLERLVGSPVVAQLRCLDFTNALSNRGARVLYDAAEVLAHVDEIWIASTKERRAEWMRMAGARAPVTPPPLGELEITNDWASRLRQRYGRRLRFDVRPRHPDL
jgi:hypothetical protein